MTIRSRPATKEYRENFDRAFGRVESLKVREASPRMVDDPTCGGCLTERESGRYVADAFHSCPARRG